MTNAPETPKPSFFSKLGSELFLGFLVTALSVFTAYTNFATYKVSGDAGGLETEGNRMLADANTEYLLATQYIIVDYDMYDGFIINDGVDDFNSQYYQDNFSDTLQASIERKSEFDDQYYNEMYADANTMFDEAFAKIDEANALGEVVSNYQITMLTAAVGLAFAAYASLLQETNRLRRVFGLMSLAMLLLSIFQFIIA